MSSPSSSFLERNALSIFLAAGVVAVFSVFMFGTGLPGSLQGDSASQAPLTASVPETTTPSTTTTGTDTTDAPADAATLLDAANTGIVPTGADTTTGADANAAAPTGDTPATTTDTVVPADTRPAAPTATNTAAAPVAAMAAPTVEAATTAPVLDTITDTSATTGGATAAMVTFTPKVVADSELLAAVLPRDFSGAALTAGEDIAMGGPDDVLVNDMRPAAPVTTTPLAVQPAHLASSGPLETALAALALALLLGWAAHRAFGKQLL